MSPAEQAVYDSVREEAAYFRAHEDEPWVSGPCAEDEDDEPVC